MALFLRSWFLGPLLLWEVLFPKATLADNLCGLRLNSQFESLSVRVRRDFASIPERDRNVLNACYASWVHWSLGQKWHAGNQILPQILATRLLAGDHHARALLRAGWQKRGDGSELTLNPPRDLSELLAGLVSEVPLGINAENLADSDVLVPAFVFERADGVPGYRFWAPGIDAYPGEAWELRLSTEQMSVRDWYEGIAQGRVPTAITEPGMKSFLEHELGHLTDYLENQEIRRQAKAFAQIVLSGKATEADFLRSEYLNEWLSVPNADRADEITRLTLPWTAKSNSPTVEERAKGLLAASGDLKQRTEQILQKVPSLLVRHGGGLRDGRSLPKFLPFSKVIRESLGLVDSRGNGAAAASLEGMLREASIFYDLRYTDTDQAWHLEDQSLKYDDLWSRTAFDAHFVLGRIVAVGRKNWERRLEARLADRIARIEIALYTWLSVGLDVPALFRETRLHVPPPGSAAYRFLKSFLPEDSRYYHAFGLGK